MKGMYNKEKKIERKEREALFYIYCKKRIQGIHSLKPCFPSNLF